MHPVCWTCHPRLSHPTGDVPTTPPCPDVLLLLLKTFATNSMSSRFELAGWPALRQVGNSPCVCIYTYL